MKAIAARRGTDTPTVIEKPRPVPGAGEALVSRQVSTPARGFETAIDSLTSLPEWFLGESVTGVPRSRSSSGRSTMGTPL